MRLAALLAIEAMYRAPFDDRVTLMTRLEDKEKGGDPVEVYLGVIRWTQSKPEAGYYSPYEDHQFEPPPDKALKKEMEKRKK